MAKTKDLTECKQAFQNAIAKNHDGLRLKTDFLDELIAGYGLESLLYLCALTIANHDWDTRFSPRNRQWAKTIDITESEDERRALNMTTHPAILDGVTDVLLKRSGQ